MTDIASALAGRTFDVTEIAGNPTSPDFTPQLTFDADGSMYGLGSVNRVRGTWSVDGQTLSFGPIAATMMMGPEDAMAQEQALLQYLAGPLQVGLDENDLLLSDGVSSTRLTVAVDRTQAGAVDDGQPAGVTISGSVVYMQRIALPPDSVTTVRLEDVSLADAPSQVISECVANGGQVPILFELGVPADAFAGNERLVVSARIECEGELLWITDTAYVVDPNNLPTDPMTIMVAQVGGSA